MMSNESSVGHPPAENSPVAVPNEGGSLRNGIPVGEKPKGLLPVPEVVRTRVDEVLLQVPVVASADARKRITDDYTLSYYYGGDVVVVRTTDQGLEVLASGAEIGSFFETAPAGLRTEAGVTHPELW